MDLKKYFNSGSKKQDLSSETSTSGGDPKKIRGGSLDNSNNLDDVFTEELSFPDCVKILYDCIKTVMLRNKYMAFTVKQKKPK